MAAVLENVELLKAMEDLHQYLSDSLPPLTVMDAIGILLEYPPEETASAIHAWVAGLTRVDLSVTRSDLLYHAVMKMYRMHEYKLVSPRKFLSFLPGLKQAILAYCPAEEREALTRNMELIGLSPALTVPSTPALVLRPGSGPKTAQLPEKEEQAYRIGYLLTRVVNRLEGLVERPGNGSGQPAPISAAGLNENVLNEALTDIARTAREAGELRQVLEHLKHQLGVQAGSEDLFRALGRTLPGWTLNPAAEGQMTQSGNLEAMHRIVAKAEDPGEAADHFRNLVESAIERFNEGALAQAASMIDVANNIIDAKEVERHIVQPVLARSHSRLNEARMRAYAESPQQRPLLRKVFHFFPGLSSQSMLENLYQCPRREQRKLLLVLLECHGEPVRAACLDHLRMPLSEHAHDSEIWYRRNLVYLLRRIPMPASEPAEETAEILLPYVNIGANPVVMKEALAYLPQLRAPKAERALIDLLQFVAMQIGQPGVSAREIKELEHYAERASAALCRFGTATARAAVVEDALMKRQGHGDVERLAEFAGSDLSDDPQTLDRLCNMLEATLPLKRLGIVLSQRERVARFLAEALSATTHPKARRLLEELAERYPETAAGHAAVAAMEKQNQAKGRKKQEARSAASMSGDIDLFGLPSLLQSFAENAVTGTLIIRSADETTACLWLAKGKLRNCTYGSLNSEAAVYQLFERPQPGTFQFVREPDTNPHQSAAPILPLVLEGMRRYDQIQEMRIQLPDNARLNAVATKPPSLESEKDGLFFRNVWMAVQKGSTPLECETAGQADSYRTRRLLAHWLRAGVIDTAQADSEQIGNVLRLKS